MTREEIIARNPIEDFLSHRGIPIKGNNGKRLSNVCPMAEHKQGHLCVTITPEANLWHCNDCHQGGSIIDWIMLSEGVDAKAAIGKLGGDTHSPPPPKVEPRARKLVKTYDYTDESGNLLFQVCRYDPKTFRQRHKKNGEWEYSMEGVRRVLYNLPKIAKADMVWLCEGEKDADTISSFGLVGTTNPMGAEKWLEEYTDQLRQKEVIILPDNDEAGRKHRDVLLKALSVAAKGIRVVEMPDGIKDVTEWVSTYVNPGDAFTAILDKAEAAEVLYRGKSLPIQSLAEMEKEYQQYVKRSALLQFDLSRWLPSIRKDVRPLVPGEMVCILAGTGVGKTMILQNIAISAGIQTLMFEMELPATLSFERFASMKTKTRGGHIYDMYSTDQTVDWKSKSMDHIHCVHKSKLNTSQIEGIIENAALKTNQRPALVLIDYVQLVGAAGDSRYERTSCVMEELKTIAKSTNTIVVVASQVARPDKKKTGTEVSLTDGKDSGSIENSSGLVVGAWRDEADAGRMFLRILKNTKGRPGATIPCRITESMLIFEETSEPH